jgi:hypothetical protein
MSPYALKGPIISFPFPMNNKRKPPSERADGGQYDEDGGDIIEDDK